MPFLCTSTYRTGYISDLNLVMNLIVFLLVMIFVDCQNCHDFKCNKEFAAE